MIFRALYARYLRRSTSVNGETSVDSLMERKNCLKVSLTVQNAQPKIKICTCCCNVRCAALLVCIDRILWHKIVANHYNAKFGFSKCFVCYIFGFELYVTAYVKRKLNINILYFWVKLIFKLDGLLCLIVYLLE